MAKHHKDRHTKYKFRWTCGGGQGSRRGCASLQKKKGKARLAKGCRWQNPAKDMLLIMLSAP